MFAVQALIVESGSSGRALFRFSTAGFGLPGFTGSRSVVFMLFVKFIELLTSSTILLLVLNVMVSVMAVWWFLHVPELRAVTPFQIGQAPVPRILYLKPFKDVFAANFKALSSAFNFTSIAYDAVFFKCAFVAKIHLLLDSKHYYYTTMRYETLTILSMLLPRLLTNRSNRVFARSTNVRGPGDHRRIRLFGSGPLSFLDCFFLIFNALSLLMAGMKEACLPLR